MTEPTTGPTTSDGTKDADATIELDQFLSHPPERVWQALTDPALHARWWAEGDVRAEVGHRFTLDMGAWGEQPCEVLAVDPGRMLRYSFASEMMDTTITWRLEPEGTGTRLVLEHRGFDLDSPMGNAAFEGLGGGWPTLLAGMEGALAPTT
jgi:uncharacterized protein YndB with AHSA1/START domain